jgi:hypothetical protein
MHLVDYLRAVTLLAHPAQPSVRELGQVWTGIVANLVWVEEIGYNMP